MVLVEDGKGHLGAIEEFDWFEVESRILPGQLLLGEVG